jgi:WD40 repeat protein
MKQSLFLLILVLAEGRLQAFAPSESQALADQQWVSGTASATLVTEPSQLQGVARWTIESRRHRGVISASAQSPDGLRLATGGVDGGVRFWNLADGSFVRAIMSHRFNIYSIAWSPDGTKLATNAAGGLGVRV